MTERRLDITVALRQVADTEDGRISVRRKVSVKLRILEAIPCEKGKKSD
jgi:hypothetical protein